MRNGKIKQALIVAALGIGILAGAMGFVAGDSTEVNALDSGMVEMVPVELHDAPLEPLPEPVAPDVAFDKIKEYLANMVSKEKKEIQSLGVGYEMPENYRLKDVLKLIVSLRRSNPELAQYIEDKSSQEETSTEPVVEEPVVEDKSRINLTANTNTKDYTYENGKININNARGFELSNETYDEIVNLLSQDPRDVGFYLYDPETGMTLSYNEYFTIHPASAVKAGVALCAAKMIDRGELSFDDIMTYESRHKEGGSGIIQNEKFGKEYTIRDLMHLTINISDNSAYYMLLEAVGQKNYNAMVDELGLDYNLNKSSKFGYTTPRDLNLIWQEIFAYRKGGEAGAYLYGEFIDAKYNYYKTAMPQYISGHKSGFNDKGYHDGSVVYCGGEDKDPYIFTILTRPLNGRNSINADSKNFTKYAQALNRAVGEYEQYKENNPDLFKGTEIDFESPELY